MSTLMYYAENFVEIMGTFFVMILVVAGVGLLLNIERDYSNRVESENYNTQIAIHSTVQGNQTKDKVVEFILLNADNGFVVGVDNDTFNNVTDVTQEYIASKVTGNNYVGYYIKADNLVNSQGNVVSPGSNNIDWRETINKQEYINTTSSYPIVGYYFEKVVD